MIAEHASGPYGDRRCFSLSLDSPSDLPHSLGLPAGHFVCLLAWDARSVSDEIISSFAKKLLRAGASYFMCWGPDCERVHDIVDQTAYSLKDEMGIPEDSVIMTTWHDSEPLREVLYFFLFCQFPSDYYFESTLADLAISIGSADWAAEIVQALNHPSEFLEAVEAEQDAANDDARPSIMKRILTWARTIFSGS